MTFDTLSPNIRRYGENPPGGYMVSIGALAHADRASQRRLQFLTSGVVLALLVGSYLLGAIYLAVSIVVFLLSGIGPIGSAARDNALDHILGFAFILHKWRLEDPARCEQWVQQAYALQPLYRVVKIVS